MKGLGFGAKYSPRGGEKENLEKLVIFSVS